MLRPRVVGEWVGREEEDADPLAAEMLHPPVPRVKTEVCWSGDNGPAGRLVIDVSKTRRRPTVCMCDSFNGDKKSSKLQECSQPYCWRFKIGSSNCAARGMPI